MTARRVAVIDIGKTNAKLALIDTADMAEIAVVTQPNTVCSGPPYPHFDVSAIWTFLLDALAGFHAQYHVDAISVTTHGAACALIAEDGLLAAPILDYEWTGPEDTADAYDQLRPAFADTGSPRLPMGLNLGAQLHWQFAQDPTLHDRSKAIVTYPQYWGYRLTGALACDMTSLGCHTDLWNPFQAEFSKLVDRLGIADKIAPPRKPSDRLGTVLPDIARKTGLPQDTPVHCGIHDSNASLLPHLMGRKAPFSVISTGTWVIAMTMGGTKVVLDPTRDTLANVNAFGDAVPSARFMGGREFELLIKGQSAECSADDLAGVANAGPLLMPAVVMESGPFQGRRHHWIGQEPAPGTPAHMVAVSFYLAMMTAECLVLTGHRGPIIVEGPFATNISYCTMLAAATGCPVMTADTSTGTSQGAAVLALGLADSAGLSRATAHKPDALASCTAYADRWREAVQRG